MIRVDNLRKHFIKDGHRIDVLMGLDLMVSRGESLAIVGPSGAGKSTLLHILGTLDRPSEGTVYYDDKDVFLWDDNNLASFRNRKIGFIFQFHNLLPEFTSLENVYVPALISGIKRSKASYNAKLLLDEMGLMHRISHKPSELSGGEQQRVAVARALMMDPDIILADEPTGNLDSDTAIKVEETLLNLNYNRKITLIMVTHNEALAARMSRTIRLRDGKITHNHQSSLSGQE